MTPESIHISTEGIINPSPEMEAKRQEAEARFNWYTKTGLNEVWLVYSNHWASQGYWIEFLKPKENGTDFIIKHHIPDL